jgi:hypothetical protein
MDTAWTAERIAGPVRRALESADVDAFGQLLSPNVQWGAPGDTSPSCRNRQQVLTWYQKGRAAGIRAEVTELVVSDQRLLVALQFGANGVPEQRWQVLMVDAEGVCDIRGYEDRASAAAAAGLPESTL